MRKYILVWKRRYADVRAGTQAPPLRFRLGRLRVAVDTVWVDYVWDGWFRLGGLRMDGFVCWLVKTVHMSQHHRCCTFDSPGLTTIGGYPG